MRSKKNMWLEITGQRMKIEYVNRFDQEEYDV